jgi:hypothetical protein
VGGYGVYKEHTPTDIFSPGEPIVLYAELKGFAHKPILSPNGDRLYNVALSAGIAISDKQGNELKRISDVHVLNITSHRQNTELFIELTLNQNRPFPVGDYVISYIVKDLGSGKNNSSSFEIRKNISISSEPSSSSSTGPFVGNDKGPSSSFGSGSTGHSDSSSSSRCPNGFHRSPSGDCERVR